jgi:hypothetical protein
MLQTLEFLYSHAHGVRGGESRNKHKGKKLKLTFNELMAKYVKMIGAKVSSQPSNVKPSSSPLIHKSKNWNQQGKEFCTSMSYPHFLPIISMLYGQPPSSFHPYSSWGLYGTWSQPPSYYAPLPL